MQTCETVGRCVTDAAELDAQLSAVGVTPLLLFPPDGRPSLAFHHRVFPWSPAATEAATALRARYAAELRFRKHLFERLIADSRVWVPSQGRGLHVDHENPDLMRIPRGIF